MLPKEECFCCVGVFLLCESNVCVCVHSGKGKRRGDNLKLENEPQEVPTAFLLGCNSCLVGDRGGTNTA